MEKRSPPKDDPGAVEFHVREEKGKKKKRVYRIGKWNKNTQQRRSRNIVPVTDPADKLTVTWQ